MYIQNKTKVGIFFINNTQGIWQNTCKCMPGMTQEFQSITSLALNKDSHMISIQCYFHMIGKNSHSCLFQSCHSVSSFPASSGHIQHTQMWRTTLLQHSYKKCSSSPAAILKLYEVYQHQITAFPVGKGTTSMWQGSPTRCYLLGYESSSVSNISSKRHFMYNFIHINGFNSTLVLANNQ